MGERRQRTPCLGDQGPQPDQLCPQRRRLVDRDEELVNLLVGLQQHDIAAVGADQQQPVVGVHQAGPEEADAVDGAAAVGTLSRSTRG